MERVHYSLADIYDVANPVNQSYRGTGKHLGFSMPINTDYHKKAQVKAFYKDGEPINGALVFVKGNKQIMITCSQKYERVNSNDILKSQIPHRWMVVFYGFDANTKLPVIVTMEHEDVCSRLKISETSGANSVGIKDLLSLAYDLATSSINWDEGETFTKRIYVYDEQELGNQMNHFELTYASHGEWTSKLSWTLYRRIYQMLNLYTPISGAVEVEQELDSVHNNELVDYVRTATNQVFKRKQGKIYEYINHKNKPSFSFSFGKVAKENGEVGEEYNVYVLDDNCMYVASPFGGFLYTCNYAQAVYDYEKFAKQIDCKIMSQFVDVLKNGRFHNEHIVETLQLADVLSKNGTCDVTLDDLFRKGYNVNNTSPFFTYNRAKVFDFFTAKTGDVLFNEAMFSDALFDNCWDDDLKYPENFLKTMSNEEYWDAIYELNPFLKQYANELVEIPVRAALQMGSSVFQEINSELADTLRTFESLQGDINDALANGNFTNNKAVEARELIMEWHKLFYEWMYSGI